MRHSYSSYQTFTQCPAKWAYNYVEFPGRERSPASPAMARGTAIHESIDDYLSGKAQRAHEDIHAKHGLFLSGLINDAKAILIPEHQWALSRNWRKVGWDSPKAYIRGFFDLSHESKTAVKIYEWKTGRIYDSHLDQRFLYGMVALILYPKVSSVTVTGVYFDQKCPPVVETYERANLTWMKEEWNRRLTAIETEKYFSPNPSFLCRYCDFNKENGGPCQF